jgi:hypothetical protein
MGRGNYNVDWVEEIKSRTIPNKVKKYHNEKGEVSFENYMFKRNDKI